MSLTSILYLNLQNYSTVTIVKTSIYDVNVKCAADTYSKVPAVSLLASQDNSL